MCLTVTWKNITWLVWLVAPKSKSSTNTGSVPSRAAAPGGKASRAARGAGKFGGETIISLSRLLGLENPPMGHIKTPKQAKAM